MLPFLDKKRTQSSGVIDKFMTPEGISSLPPEKESDGAGLEAAAEDIMRAIEAKDSKHLALALQAAFDIMESAPHEEASEPEEKEEE